MHKLLREVRFSVNPFLDEDDMGFNTYASSPAGQGLAVFLVLSVELTGKLDPSAGFVVNVRDIDRNVRKYAIDIFAQHIREKFGQAAHIDISQLAEILGLAWKKLEDKFADAQLTSLALKLNPFRKISIDSKEFEMIYFSEKFEFAATHKLWNKDFSNERNFDVFGKCANPSGHGHNYVVEVTVKTETDKDDFCISSFEKTVNDELIELLDHKNLNDDIKYFSQNIPTMENIAVYAWDRIVNKFKNAKLHCITVWETDKTYCSYYGS
ncbi:MAG: 6-carboxytetrahydropterin synthase [Planctomycetota bacterium]|jgi:6-pyruvoyltetrahydropterin/6-carboxytetrahydropterin synthase